MSGLEKSAARAVLEQLLNDAEQSGGKLAPERWWRFFAEISQGAIAQELDTAGLEGIGWPDPWATHDWKKLEKQYHLHVLACLLQQAAPMFPTEFKWGVVADDLVQILNAKSGDTPQILESPPRERHVNLKNNMRRAFVLGVIFRAAKEGVTRTDVLGHLRVGMSAETWKSWLRSVPRPTRDEAIAAGREGRDWPRSSDEELQTLYHKGFGQALA